MSIDLDSVIFRIRKESREFLATEFWSRQISSLEEILPPKSYFVFDFLQYDGQVFVVKVYRKLLGRYPTADELKYYLLLPGILETQSKLNIIDNVLRSPECPERKNKINIIGFFEFSAKTKLLLRLRSQCLFNYLAQCLCRGWISRDLTRFVKYKLDSQMTRSDILFFLSYDWVFPTSRKQRLIRRSIQKMTRIGLSFLQWPLFFLFSAPSKIFDVVLRALALHQTRSYYLLKSDFERVLDDKLSEIVSQLGTMNIEAIGPRQKGMQPRRAGTIVESGSPYLPYFEYENEFRGPEGLIRERLAAYLPKIMPLYHKGDFPMALDVGFGRCEWMSLLRENNVPVVGLDIDSDLVERARSKGFEVYCSDAVEWLAGHPADSLGLISAFHVVEHMEFESLKSFLAEAYRALCPGGVILFETPNPENLLVGSFEFWLDPTHKRPYPSQTLAFWTKALGFTDVEVIKLNPYNLLDDTGVTQPSLRNIIYRFNLERDYAILAKKKV